MTVGELLGGLEFKNGDTHKEQVTLFAIAIFPTGITYDVNSNNLSDCAN